MYKIKDFEIKTSPSDMTIGEFEKVIDILNNPLLDNIEKYFNIFEYFGMPKKILDELTDNEFYELVKQYSYELEHIELIPTIEIDGYLYRSYPDGGEFKLNARDLNYIEKAIKNEANSISKILAVIFKRQDLDNSEHYSPAHINHKAKLFRELNSEILIPYLTIVSYKITKGLKDSIDNQKNVG